MKKILYNLLLLSLLVMMGCASTAHYHAIMKSQIGKTMKELEEALGRPQHQYVVDGRQYRVYRRSDVGVAGAGNVVTGQPSADGGHGVFREGTQGTTYFKKWCQTTFIIYRGKVESYIAKGNNCRL